MADFENSTDIANRALQHVGGTRIDALTDDSKNAAAVAFCYDKLRRAELRRNVWRFSIRRAILRPIDEDSRLLTGVAWAVGTSYGVGAIVTRDGRLWQTSVTSTGEAPGADGSPWDIYCGTMTIQPYDADIAYYPGELVSDGGNVYLSLTMNNEQEPPDTQWVLIGDQDDVSEPLVILYPIEAGPSSDTNTANVYRLPGGFLRQAPEDPKAGSTSWLGAPSGLQYSDFRFEGQYIVTTHTPLIMLRFAADVTNVLTFDPMFCEGLAARIGLETCEEITQSSEKLSNIGAQYKLFMGEARTVNAIELGPTEPPEDDWITCRR